MKMLCSKPSASPCFLFLDVTRALPAPARRSMMSMAHELKRGSKGVKPCCGVSAVAAVAKEIKLESPPNAKDSSASLHCLARLALLVSEVHAGDRATRSSRCLCASSSKCHAQHQAPLAAWLAPWGWLPWAQIPRVAANVTTSASSVCS